MAVPVRQPGSGRDVEQLREKCKKQMNQALDFRKQLEPIWLSNLAFAGGAHWQVWDDVTRSMRHIGEMDPRYEDRQLYTADKTNEHVQAQLGELESDDDRPELLLAQEGDTAEEIQKELNDCAAHGWEYEWGAASALKQARRLCLKLGTSAIRVLWDPTKGESRLTPTGPDGRPALDQATLDYLEQHGTMPDGSLPQFASIHDGQTVWEPLSAFNILVPAGVTHEDSLPWEGVVRPVLIDTLIELYGDKARSLVEDTDIASLMGISTTGAARTGNDRSGDKGRLRDHVWLYTRYERPNQNLPKGRVVVLASSQMTLLDVVDELPKKTVTGAYRSGIHYMHWWRLDDRFYSRSMIEPLKDPQRLINEVKTSGIEIMRRGYPKVFVKEGTLVHNPAGLPLEVIELKDDAKEPNFFAGIGPNEYMSRMASEASDDLAHASTLSALRLGENPANVKTLGQLALLNENEAAKRSTILQEHKASIAGALEDSMHDVRAYWPEEKQILVSGDEGAIRRKTFSKSRIPDFYVVRPASGSAKPRSQGAELTKVDAIWNAAIACGIAVGPNAEKWIDWYAKSLDAGQPLELPEAAADSQADMARFENFLMLDQGEDVAPADYDIFPVHLPIHREAQNQARAAGDMAAYQRIQSHVDRSQQLIAVNAAKMAAAAQAPSPLAPDPAVPGLSPLPGPPPLAPPAAPSSPPDALSLAAAAAPPAG